MPQKGTELRARVSRIAGGDVAVLRIRFAPITFETLSLPRAAREVAELVMAGFTNRDIARRRGVSVRTVENQVAALFRYTKTHSRAELIALLAMR